jgi:transcriptional regulator with XRE-family HTH domain
MDKQTIIKNLINNINSACAERNMSINEFCHKCNVHKSVMDNLKRNSAPSIDIIANIAIFLNISIDELIGLKGETNVDIINQKTMV